MTREPDRASLARAVAALERDSAAEAVLVLRPRSGSYAHAVMRCGAATGFLAILFMLFTPWTFPPTWVPSIVVIAFAVGIAAASVLPSLQRWMSSGRERTAAVRTHAAAAFVQQGVANTARRTGLLIYHSKLERQTEVMADRGILEAVPNERWNEVVGEVSRCDRVASLPAALEPLRSLLARHLPSSPDDADELSNEIRILPP